MFCIYFFIVLSQTNNEVRFNRNHDETTTSSVEDVALLRHQTETKSEDSTVISASEERRDEVVHVEPNLQNIPSTSTDHRVREINENADNNDNCKLI